MPLACLLSFRVLTFPFLRVLQKVNASYSLVFVSFSDLSLPLRFPGRECHLTRSPSFRVLTGSLFLPMRPPASERPSSVLFLPVSSLVIFLFTLQLVSATCSLAFSPQPHLSPFALSRKWVLLFFHLLSMSSLVPPTSLSRKSVPLTHSLSFYVLTCPLICILQFVSAPFSLAFFPRPNFPLRSSGSECPTPTCSFSFCVLTCLSVYSRK